MMKRKLFGLMLLILTLNALAGRPQSGDGLSNLQIAYPKYVKEVKSKYIAWQDGSRIPIDGPLPLLDRAADLFYGMDRSYGSISKKEVKRKHYTAVFKKMYGRSKSEVKKNLVTIYWMPKVFGKRYPLEVTTINGIDKKLRRISARLEKLPSSYYKFLDHPAGSFYWRNVLGESYLSTHSFGIAIDINSQYSNYWAWDVKKLKRPIQSLKPHHKVPLQIVKIFEKEGFIWGGRWYYYDTMHFEYRPELM